MDIEQISSETRIKLVDCINKIESMTNKMWTLIDVELDIPPSLIQQFLKENGYEHCDTDYEDNTELNLFFHKYIPKYDENDEEGENTLAEFFILLKINPMEFTVSLETLVD